MGMGLRFGFGPLRIFIPLGGRKRRRRRRTMIWTHGTCTIQHRTQQAAQRCKGHV